jgi:hypothetical protein
LPDLTATAGTDALGVPGGVASGAPAGIESITVPSGGVGAPGVSGAGVLAGTAAGAGAFNATSGAGGPTSAPGTSEFLTGGFPSTGTANPFGVNQLTAPAPASIGPSAIGSTAPAAGGGPSALSATDLTAANTVVSQPTAFLDTANGLQVNTGGGSPASGIGNFISKNPGAAVGAAGIGIEALTRPKLPSESSLIGNLSSTASQLSGQASQLESYINTGNLPPGVMQAVQQATASAKAAVRSQYASLGLTGSTAEVTALSEIDSNAAGQVASIAQSLLTTGINESQISASLYESILSSVTAENNALSGSIASFAAALAGGSIIANRQQAAA